MLWKYKGPVHIEEIADAPNCNGRTGYRFHCKSETCKGRAGHGTWRTWRARAELGADHHYADKHQ